MPFFICPRCKTRRIDEDGREGLSQEPPSCHHCDFGFMFELLEDYYPAQATGLIVCDQEGRVLATGHGVFELTGFEEPDLMGRNLAEALQLSDTKPIETVREWGVRQLGKHAVAAHPRRDWRRTWSPTSSPAYDDEGGMLVALTPH